MVIDDLKQNGAIHTKGRFGRSDKISTAAGVSAGIDMALELLRIMYGETA